MLEYFLFNPSPPNPPVSYFLKCFPDPVLEGLKNSKFYFEKCFIRGSPREILSFFGGEFMYV